MRNAVTILDIFRARGQRRLPLQDVYRQLFNPDLYLRAYGRLYSRQGAMTPGVTEETVDGMSLAKIEKLIEALRYERYRWTAVRRVEIPKKNGKTRPLGIPTWSDKLLQEVIRSLLEAYYEPQFSDHAHGFRPERGCHTALSHVYHAWTGTKWFVEGDIHACFDSIEHDTLLTILGENIHDNRFLRLIRHLLEAGYLQEWNYKPTLSGTPQGGVLSPLLANIYFDKLDKYVENTLLPEYTRGAERKANKAYVSLNNKAGRLRRAGAYQEARQLRQQAQRLPSKDTHDPDFRRLRYVRYADDFLLGFLGPKAEAETIKEKLRTFLRESLKLELSPEKTLITHASTQAARFLGYDILALRCDTKHDRLKRRVINGVIGLRVPAEVVTNRCKRYMRRGKPWPRHELHAEDDYSIVHRYQAEYRGYVQYYLLATNVCWLGRLYWIMETSLLKTLASKHKTKVSAMLRKYLSKMPTEHGPRRCLLVQKERMGKEPLRAYFGGLCLRRQKRAFVQDLPTYRYKPRHTEIVKRLLAHTCEICGASRDVEVHHVRRLADLHVRGRKEKPAWMRLMAARHRKSLVLCRSCHQALHKGEPLEPHRAK